MLEETELRVRLESLAAHTAPPPRSVDDLTVAVAEQDRAGRRRQYALVGLAAAVVAVLLAVPLARSALDENSETAAPSQSPQSSADVYESPTRGSLAEDAEFLDDVRDLSWALEGFAGYPAPPVADRHVVWAADVDGTRWALVAGDNSELLAPAGGAQPPPVPGEPGRPHRVVVAWFMGPEGADAEQMALAGVEYGIPTDEPAALVDLATETAVVVAAPSDRIEVSPRPLVGAVGDISRRYDAVDAQDGVAVLTLDADLTSALGYRVQRDGAWVTGRPGVHATSGSEGPVREFPLDRLRPAPASALGDAAVPVELENVLALTGLTPADVTFTVVWAGDMPLQTGIGAARLTVVAVELPSGASYVTAVVGWDAGGGQLRSASCGSQIRSAVIPIDEDLFVLGCDDIAAERDVPFENLVVIAPPGTATAQGLTPDGDVRYSWPLTDGVAVVEAPTGISDVQVLDAGGTVLRHGHPRSGADLDD